MITTKNPNPSSRLFTLPQRKLIEKGIELAGILNCHPILRKPFNTSLTQHGLMKLKPVSQEMVPFVSRIQENIWIIFLIEELYNEKKKNPSQFNVDNKGLIDKINNLGLTKKTKHLDIKANWLCDLKKNNEILVKLIPSEAMIADALTQPSNQESLNRLKAKCLLVTVVFSSMVGGVETWLLEHSCDT
ncbi:hypothetical protein VP01_4095g2 [Puccinia sorghi]|uniref:Uncharacterized protein n=1 Tax=Puccinia sorghi TaxID=27349 RepID=A0A0L6URE9_9BASI|nr:hypothetical protein VP01_4095g2 [Puccinia sorghi]